VIQESIATLKATLQGGVTPAMATPLVPGTYTVNRPVVGPLVDFLVGAGVRGLFVGGTTGEGVLLDIDQRMAIGEATIAAARGRVPVLLHVGDQRTSTAASLARHAREAGAAAVVALTPYFYGISDDALARYFHGIAEAVPDLPLFLYDIPQFAVNGISPALLGRLCREIPSLAGLKSSRVDVQIVRQLVDAVPPDRMLLAGNESAALGLLSLGANGLISGLSTAVPEPFVAMTAAFSAGDMAAAQRWQKTINQMLGVLPATARLGGIKRVLEERGIPVGTPVPELPATSDELWPRMAQALEAARG
jgi:dihydrodipicolinate synthase/N-acetylneuraminate lyase